MQMGVLKIFNFRTKFYQFWCAYELFDHVAKDKFTVTGLKIVGNHYNIVVLWTRFNKIDQKIFYCSGALENSASLSIETVVMF